MLCIYRENHEAGSSMENKTFEERKKIIYEFISDPHYVPMKQKELAVILQVAKEDREELGRVLEALLGEGKIELSKRGRYSKAQPRKAVGTFTSHARGFGFVSVEGQEQDIFIGENDTGDAFLGDTVEVAVKGRGGRRPEGVITKVLAHSVTEVIGTFERSKNFGFVIPDNQRINRDIFIPLERTRGAVTGQKVTAEITDYGRGRKNPEGRITQILGEASDPETEVLSIIMAYGLPTEFPERVENQAERVAKPVSAADRAGRLDLREEVCVTIDGEDARDLDDAVSLTREGDNYKLGVHIADVANYVQERSALDREALKRGTSVYLADRVIPMLPHKLSNGICSLNAGEDRLALSCIMTVKPSGDVTDHIIAETVIRVDKRMSYNGVARMLSGDEKELGENEAFVPMIKMMKELSDIVRGRRGKRGSVNFDFPETKVILDEKGRAADIRPYERNDATKIIEDFMLLANETVAEEYYWREIPFLYRTHEQPDEEKIRQLNTFVNNFGYHIHMRNEIRPKEIQKLLDKAEGTPEEALISRLTLRSMKRARYTPDNAGHFGLAAKYYTHFTSPIRRYPDLQIHRIIKEDLRGRLTEERMEHYRKILPETAVQCSDRERIADEAEREVVRLKKAEYMQSHIGEEYEGVISGVTKWGVYVELPNTVEGLVHVADMRDDHYEFLEQSYELCGQHTGRTFKLGQTVTVRVTNADRLQRTVNFEIIS